jgi:hypothetical protein
VLRAFPARPWRHALNLRGIKTTQWHKTRTAFLPSSSSSASLSSTWYFLSEENRGGFFTLSDLPSLLVSLLVSYPVRISAAERPQVHPKNKDVDAVVNGARDGIEG